MDDSVWGPYVPELLADWLRDAPDAAPAPRQWRTYAAAMVVDISGFTSLTERLAQAGPGGAEVLADLVDTTFGTIIDEVASTGGDVGQFAGDAVVALWPADPAEPGPAVRAAIACGHALQVAIGATSTRAEIQIRVRAGVAVGEVWSGTVGGVKGAWRYVIGSTPIVAAGVAASRASPDQVVATIDAAGAAGVSGTFVDEGHVRVEAEDLAIRGGGQGPATRVVPSGRVGLAERPITTDRLAPYLPRELVARIQAEPSGWLAEFRRVSAVFVAIADLDYRGDRALPALQDAAVAAQSAIERYGGSLNQLVVEDKGTIIVAAWGLPDRTHEDDAVRAVLAAQGIVEALTGLGLRAGAGVASGRAFCGVRGNAIRREYGVLGDVMNTAARLMQAADGDVRVDASTAREAEARVPMGSLGTMAAKGKAAELSVFRPIAAASVAAAATSLEVAGPSPVTADRRKEGNELIGREAEWSIIANRLDALRSTRRGGVIAVVGEPGIGKSSLIGRVAREGAGVRHLRGDSDAIEEATPYYVWRQPMLDLFGGGSLDASALAAAVLATLDDDPDLRARAPLLDAILPLELPQTPLTSGMESLVRADAVRDLVAHLLGHAARVEPLVVVLDDAHWMDSSSWTLALAVARRVPGVLIVLTTRPMSDPVPFEFGRLLDEPGAVRIDLEPLGEEAALSLVRNGLGVESLPPSIEAFITERAEGNPFFSEQLAFALRDSGYLLIEDAVGRLAPGIADLGALDIPQTVQGVVTGRIDRLAPAEQLTLKVGSVIGRLFRLRILGDIHPFEASRDLLRDQLDHAGRLDLTTLATPEPDLAYLFKHVITQEVAYDLLVYAQRRPLHRAVARWYEENTVDLEPHLPLLAYHWTRAEETDKALEYLERSAGQALGQHANIEALRSIDQALSLDAAHGYPAGPKRRSRWERWAGIAFVKTSRYRLAREPFETSLQLSGSRLPRSRWGLGLALGRELIVQLGQRIRMPRLPADRRESARERSETYRYYAEVSYWANDVPSLAHALLRALNAAGPAGDSRELVAALGNFRFLLGLVGLRPIGRFYRRLRDATSARVGDVDAEAYNVFLESIIGIVEADWEQARADAERAAGMFKTIGDRMRWHTNFSLIGFAHLHQGWFDRARPYFEEGLRAIGVDGARQARIWSLGALLATDLARGSVDQADVDTLEGLLGPEVDVSDEIWVRGLVAQARLRAGDVDAAVVHARAAVPLIRHFPPASWHTYLGSAKTAEVLLDLWRADESPKSAWARDARRAVGGLNRFAWFNRDARPRAALLSGRAAHLAGQTDDAIRAWRRSARLAARQNMPYDEALALEAIALALPAGDPDRARGLERALSLVQPLGATVDETRIRTASMEGGSGNAG